ncbi:MAG: hypothetical protein ABSB84_09615 [Verrucomicrobiota bacterium]|jgi:hypothetical protein
MKQVLDLLTRVGINLRGFFRTFNSSLGNRAFADVVAGIRFECAVVRVTRKKVPTSGEGNRTVKAALPVAQRFVDSTTEYAAMTLEFPTHARHEIESDV